MQFLLFVLLLVSCQLVVSADDSNIDKAPTCVISGTCFRLGFPLCAGFDMGWCNWREGGRWVVDGMSRRGFFEWWTGVKSNGRFCPQQQGLLETGLDLGHVEIFLNDGSGKAMRDFFLSSRDC